MPGRAGRSRPRSRAWAATNWPARSPRGTKQISWLSSFSAVGKPRPARVSANLRLRQFSDGEPGRLELIRRQVVEEIRLVLVGVLSFPEHGPSRGGVRAAARVVTRRDRFAAHDPRPLPESRELHLRVAGGARESEFRPRGRKRRRAARRRRGTPPRDSGRNAGCPSDQATRRASERSSSVQQRPVRPASPGMVPELHREADDFVPLLLESRAATEESTPPDMATAMRMREDCT